MTTSVRPAALQAAFDRAERNCEASRWNLTVRAHGVSMIDLVGRGQAAGRAFAARSDAIRLTADPAGDLVPAAVAELERRLAAIADRFHSALPIPLWTNRIAAGLSARQKVERARTEYAGERMEAIVLGRTDWIAYALESALDPRAHEHVRVDGIAVRPGADLRYQITPL